MLIATDVATGRAVGEGDEETSQLGDDTVLCDVMKEDRVVLTVLVQQQIRLVLTSSRS